MADVTLTSLFRGVPFLDDQFDAAGLLTAVACVRRHRDESRGLGMAALDAYIQPDIARESMQQHYGLHVEILSNALNDDLLGRIGRAISDVTETRATWPPLFDVPLVFRLIPEEGVTSRTIPAIPQHIYLGMDAFVSDELLRETIIHEVSHVWLGLVTEVWRLHDVGAPGGFVLPSGTANKTATQVLFASLFAAAVHRYYDALGPLSVPRAEHFARYLAGSLATLETYAGLTPAGEDVRTRLAAYSGQASPAT